jgi:hypothetical protein
MPPRLLFDKISKKIDFRVFCTFHIFISCIETDESEYSYRVKDDKILNFNLKIIINKCS